MGIDESVTHFSASAIRLLKEAGWYPNRSVDISDITMRLKQAGYELSTPILDFLREFGDLELHRDNGRKAVFLTFEELDAWEHEVRPIREYLNLSLCPVANTHGSVMLMDTEGQVYDTDAISYFVLLGQTGVEALDNILHRRFTRKILDIDELRKIIPPIKYE